MRTDGAPPLSVSLLPTWSARAEPSSSAELKSQGANTTRDDARRRREETVADRRARERPLIAGNLRIELDAEAGYFVQTLTDPTTSEVLRRFPHESQLAFARAVRAYEQARQRGR